MNNRQLGWVPTTHQHMLSNLINRIQKDKLYEGVDDAHSFDYHIVDVVNKSAYLMTHHDETFGKLDEKIILISAALHDIGLRKNRKTHETSGALMVDDLNKKGYFKDIDGIDENVLLSIKDCIREHRSSNGNPDSVLGEIVADADTISFDHSARVIRSTLYQVYNLGMTDPEKAADMVMEHMINKFGKNGYSKLHTDIGNKLNCKPFSKNDIKKYRPLSVQIVEGRYLFESNTYTKINNVYSRTQVYYSQLGLKDIKLSIII